MRFELGQRIIDKIRKPFIRVRTRIEYKDREIDLKFKLKEMFEVCNDLADDYSKETYLNVLQYRLNSNFKIKSALPEPSSEICEKIKVKGGKEFKVCNGELDFYEVSLAPLGVDLRCYMSPTSVYFMTQQYEYNVGGVDIDIKDGDILIDGGACFGETALWFAYKVGEKGRVYSFEFIEENLKVFKEALDLNPRLKKRIKILNNALYSNSDSNLYVYESGPGSFCSTQVLVNGGGNSHHDKNQGY